MISDRKPNVWEVLVEGGGKTITEKVHAWWSPDFEGTKQSIAHAAVCQAGIRNRGKEVTFSVVSEPKLIGKLGAEAVAA